MSLVVPRRTVGYFTEVSLTRGPRMFCLLRGPYEPLQVPTLLLCRLFYFGYLAMRELRLGCPYRNSDDSISKKRSRSVIEIARRWVLVQTYQQSQSRVFGIPLTKKRSTIVTSISTPTTRRLRLENMAGWWPCGRTAVSGPRRCPTLVAACSSYAPVRGLTV